MDKKDILELGVMDEETYNKNLSTVENMIKKKGCTKHKFIKTNEHLKYKYRCKKCGILSPKSR